jgi:hypothetical protein
MVAYVALLCDRIGCGRKRECGCGLVVKERERRTLQALHVHIYRMHFEDGQVKTIVFRISKIQ